MKILILSTFSDTHAIAVHWGLTELGCESTFWDWDDFPAEDRSSWSISSNRKAKMSWHIGEQSCSSEFAAIWYRRPGKPTPSRQSHPDDSEFIRRESGTFLNNCLPFLANDKARWINHPLDAKHADNKMVQLTLARELGFTIPDTLIGNDPATVRHFFAEHDGKVIYKGFLPNTWNKQDGGATAVCTSALTRQHVENDYAISGCPGIYQERIEKQYEVRITVMNDTVLAGRIDSQGNGDVVDWRTEFLGDRIPLKAMALPPEIEKSCIALCRRLNLAFCAIDMIVTRAGEYVFLEVNESGQFLWKEHVDPTLPMLDTFCRALMQRAKVSIPDGAKTLRLSDWFASESHAEYRAYREYLDNQPEVAPGT